MGRTEIERANHVMKKLYRQKKKWDYSGMNREGKQVIMMRGLVIRSEI